MTPTTTAEPPQAAPATTEAKLHALLDDVFAEVWRVFTELKAKPQQADGFLAGRLGFQMTPEENRTVRTLALEDLGDLRVPAYKALTLWLVGRRLKKNLFEQADPDPAPILRTIELLPQMLGTMGLVDAELGERAKTARGTRAQLIQQISDHLLPSRGMLAAAWIIGPQLDEFARAVSDREIERALPSASPKDLALLASIYCAEELEPERKKAAHPCVCALMLLEAIDTDLTAWEALNERRVHRSALNAAFKTLEERLTRDKLAYDYMFERLQRHQETALKSGDKSLASGLQRIQGRLFSAQIKLAGLARDGASSTSAKAEKMDPAELQRLLAEGSAADARTKPEQPQTPEQKDYATESRDAVRDALQGMDEPTPAPVVEAEPTSRRRVAILLALSVILLVACVVSYARLLTRPDAPQVRVPVAELNADLPLDDAMVVGPLMYAKVGHDVWQSMSEAGRIDNVKDLGLKAIERKCEKVYLTDESGRHLASWTREEGVQIVKHDKG